MLLEWCYWDNVLQTQTFHLKDNFTKLYKRSSTKVLGQVDSPSVATQNVFFGSELVKAVFAFLNPRQLASFSTMVA